MQIDNVLTLLRWRWKLPGHHGGWGSQWSEQGSEEAIFMFIVEPGQGLMWKKFCPTGNWRCCVAVMQAVLVLSGT